MAQKQQRRTMLLVPLDEARAQIRERIEKGRKLLELRIGNDADLQQAQDEKKKWTDFNDIFICTSRENKKDPISH
jgi:hypothetical protein